LSGVLLFSAFAGVSAEAESRPKIQFEKTILDIGHVVEGESIPGKFTFRNTGAAVLEIQQPETSCGCTVASVKPERLKPGEKGEIEFTLDLTNIRGPAEKTITVPSNDPETPSALLIIKAEVKALFQHDPELLFFGEVQPGQAAKGVIHLKRLDGKKLRITKAQTQDFITVKIEPEKNSNGEAAQLVVEAKPEGKAGAFTDMLTLFMDDLPKASLIIPLAGQLLGGLKTEPDALVWDLPDPAHWPGPTPEATTVRKLIVSATLATNTFEISEPASDLEDLLIKFAPIEKGRKYQVLLKLDQPHKESTEGMLTFETSLPSQPRLEVPIKINVGKPATEEKK